MTHWDDSGGGGGSNTWPIADTADDGHDLTGGWDPTAIITGQGGKGVHFDAGVRFPLTEDSPSQGDTIDVATLTYQVTLVNNAGGVTNTYGYDIDDAGAWDGVGPDTVPVTGSPVAQTFGSTGSVVLDVKGPAQIIVDRAGYVKGGVMAFVTRDNGSPSSNNSHLEDLAAAGGNEAVLHMEWS